MSPPPAVRFAGRQKWGEVAADLALAGGGTLLAALGAAAMTGRDPVGLLLLVAYTAYAVAATLVLAGVVAATRQLPTLTEGVVDQKRAVVARSWAAPWWHTVALDAGLAAVGIALLGAGVGAGADWGLVATVPGVVGLWFLVRVVLVLVGRRRRPALWLTDDELVLDFPAGRARSARADVASVRSRARRLVVDLDRDAAWELCPRPWRSAVADRRTLVLDCSDLGHRADDLAAWLAGELDGSGSAPPVSSGRRRERNHRAP
ncbi:hypothetical protein [Nocardioides sp. SYSU D00065]|uniref:hypothetical protein n=1 Tax=Nocardioides sp. SYSU D00065 TaxID=2817378 RepID=UPI001B3255EF|nr:hypothetical protein [Nocardioides sp. SYSU D00065]